MQGAPTCRSFFLLLPLPARAANGLHYQSTRSSEELRIRLAAQVEQVRNELRVDVGVWSNKVLGPVLHQRHGLVEFLCVVLHRAVVPPLHNGPERTQKRRSELRRPIRQVVTSPKLDFFLDVVFVTPGVLSHVRPQNERVTGLHRRPPCEEVLRGPPGVNDIIKHQLIVIAWEDVVQHQVRKRPRHRRNVTNTKRRLPHSRKGRRTALQILRVWLSRQQVCPLLLLRSLLLLRPLAPTHPRRASPPGTRLPLLRCPSALEEQGDVLFRLQALHDVLSFPLLFLLEK